MYQCGLADRFGWHEKSQTLRISRVFRSEPAVTKRRARAHSKTLSPPIGVSVFWEDTGRLMFRLELPSQPLPGGLLVDREGRIVVTMPNVAVAAFGRQR